MRMIPYGKQHIEQDDIDAVVATLKADFLTQGPKVLEFEQKFANYLDVKYAVAVNNATSGLHLAILALGFKTRRSSNNYANYVCRLGQLCEIFCR